MPNSFVYIEDDALSSQIMSFIMVDELGHDLYILQDSTHFAAWFDQLPVVPDLIFLDIHMAPYNGFDILAWLGQSVRFQHVPTVATTASVMNEEIEALKQAGFFSCIAKPIDFDTFPDILNHLLRHNEIWVI